ncbi:DoxX family protein [Tengunoibacter tsumagoiensis]|uniref:DoxX family protein n=1 Tax=Tengunoibacter tsumagoiensis TaxID=2014871 RepID=A0A402A8E1_9CHLR|nr:DoxX family protein [Tengunoibacter tsumagoiensis]GCE15276.1 hypothetical protein KTT_51350 [Tengunoibacter tsumagoiensis]
MTGTISGSSVNQQTSSGRNLFRSIALWTLQILLALLFLATGCMKLLTPPAVMQAQLAVPFPQWFIYFIGVAECAGGLGLLLPGILRIQRRLTPIAACGLVIITIGAVAVTLLGGMGIAAALFPLIVSLLCALIVFARRSWFAQA